MKIGRIQNGVQEILEGVKDGELVATSGQGKLTEGMKVTLQTLAPPRAPNEEVQTIAKKK